MGSWQARCWKRSVESQSGGGSCCPPSRRFRSTRSLASCPVHPTCAAKVEKRTALSVENADSWLQRVDLVLLLPTMLHRPPSPDWGASVAPQAMGETPLAPRELPGLRLAVCMQPLPVWKGRRKLLEHRIAVGLGRGRFLPTTTS